MKRNESRILKDTLSKIIPVCTGCGKCSEVCPAEIDIPEALRIYEKYRIGDSDILNRLNEMQSDGKPIDCIECGACSAHCPRGIEVKKIMRTLSMMQSCKTWIPCIHVYRSTKVQ